jgi:hypothetical protein
MSSAPVHGYGPAKAAVVRFAETLAQEVEGEGILVNCVAPGFVATRMQEETLAAGERAGAGYVESVRNRLEQGAVPPELAADAVAFLDGHLRIDLDVDVDQVFDPGLAHPQFFDGGNSVNLLGRLPDRRNGFGVGLRIEQLAGRAVHQRRPGPEDRRDDDQCRSPVRPLVLRTRPLHRGQSDQHRQRTQRVAAVIPGSGNHSTRTRRPPDAAVVPV